MGFFVGYILYNWIQIVLGCPPQPQVAILRPPPCGNKQPQFLIPGSVYPIASPIQPNGQAYYPNLDCTWMFDVAAGCQPFLECNYFDISNSEDCTEDFLKVFDGPQKTLRLCGRAEIGQHFQYLSEGFSFFDLQFLTNQNFESAGFSCQLTCKSKVTTVPTTTRKPSNSSQNSGICDCGKAEFGRIIGGSEAKQNELSFQVALKYEGKFLCGGSVIGPSYVLTASHCSRGRDASKFEILLGSYNLSAGNEQGSVRRGVSEIIFHPKTDPTTLDYDFSILKLSSPVDLNQGAISAICLPKDDSDDFANLKVVASGWGTRNATMIDLPAILNKVELVTSPPGKCGQYQATEIKESMLCAGNPGKDACQGDSGGPLSLLRNGTYTLIGVTSWGIGCATPGFPGVYARVSKVLDWIKTSTSGNICSPRD